MEAQNNNFLICHTIRHDIMLKFSIKIEIKINTSSFQRHKSAQKVFQRVLSLLHRARESLLKTKPKTNGMMAKKQARVWKEQEKVIKFQLAWCT